MRDVNVVYELKGLVEHTNCRSCIPKIGQKKKSQTKALGQGAEAGKPREK